MAEYYPHIHLHGPDSVSRFTTPPKAQGAKSTPSIDRQAHGQYLQNRLRMAWKETESEYVAVHAERTGVYLEFQSSPGFELAIKSLEDLRKGIRLCNVRKVRVRETDSDDEDKDTSITYATVYIPNDKRQFFAEKIEQYLQEDTKKGKPRNARLVESISQIQKALRIDSFWVDDTKLIPREVPEWCEVWLRGDTDAIINRFDKLIKTQRINSKPGYIRFPERTVKLICVTQKQLQDITTFSDDVAEFRSAKHTAEFFLTQRPAEQAE